MTTLTLALICLLLLGVTLVALACRHRAFAERDEARREAREWKAATYASEQLRDVARAEIVAANQARDDYRRLWYAGRQPLHVGSDEPDAIATGPRLYGDDRQARPERCDED